jgi:REP element-mobilizing transposase RayT
MAPKFSYFVQYKNSYFHVKLPLSRIQDLLYFFHTCVYYAIFTFGCCRGSSIDQWEIFYIMQYFNFILVDNKTSHSVDISSWNRYVDNIHTLLENMKFIYTSIRNLKKRGHYTSLSDLFHSDWK